MAMNSLAAQMSLTRPKILLNKSVQTLLAQLLPNLGNN